MSNIISSLGGGSGIDTTNLVSQLTQLERAPKEQRLDTRQEKLEAQISGYGALKSAMSEFQSLMAPLGGSDIFNARSVAFPETNVITPNSLAAGAQAGSYQIEVLDVARAQSLVMGGSSDRNAPLGATGELNIQFGEWGYDTTDPNNPIPDSFTLNDNRPALNITVEATDTLQTLADKINKGDSGVQASVMKVDGQFQLMLSAPSGGGNAMQITASDPSLSAFEFNATNQGALETQQASDAVLKINGLEVRRETNTINDVIDGFDFTLNRASVGETVSFSIDADKGVAQQAIRDFVEGYNSFLQTAKNLTGVTKDEDGNTVRGELAGDGTAKSLISQLRSMIGSEVQGLESGFTALTNLGIRTELDGTLSINEKEFTAAMTDNFDQVGQLFARKASSSNNFVDVGIGARAGGTVAGQYNVEITQDPSKGSIQTDAVAEGLFDTPFDAGAGDNSFRISVNGTRSNLITLTGTYTSAEEMRAELQSLINGDERLKGVNAQVDVAYDEGTGQFSFTSRDYGKTSTVSFSGATAAMADLGISDDLLGTQGKDVQGTINGVKGFGAGEVLLPELGSDAYGLNLTVRPGASSQGAFTMNFSQGVSGELSGLIERFLGQGGAISSREENIDKQLEEVAVDREDLDRRMEQYETRISAQFLAMERIISSLNGTGDSLDGLIDRLPFTAKK
ncbi:flagellar filament capping protein FliD [Marinobacterium weihaiense]|uniref:Flagellar hook-associated protein 2 n=1 Tax=Marinobacterium weihaiense TaxID=2851016 RepID=A0ABS6MDY1_9GAMM|nr:flagellar filament capping protein FliD [Marinobacterium weihaiense]MBV0934046.1 flagellar filament capping protein FliD [Marinobacterium weihaiense]